MKLGKLLAAGKSLAGGHGQIVYRQNKHVYLPKFNSPKNSFVAKGQAEPSKFIPETPGVAEKKIFAPPTTVQETQPALAVKSAPQKAGTTWTSKLNSL